MSAVAAPRAPAAAPRTLALEPPSLDDALALAQRLVAAAGAYAAAFGGLDPIDLPSVGGGELDQARIRSLGPLSSG